jgi:hypothetical protein
MDLTIIKWEEVQWVQPALDRIWWWAFVNIQGNLSSTKGGKYFNRLSILTFSQRFFLPYDHTLCLTQQGMLGYVIKYVNLN